MWIIVLATLDPASIFAVEAMFADWHGTGETTRKT